MIRRDAQRARDAGGGILMMDAVNDEQRLREQDPREHRENRTAAPRPDPDPDGERRRRVSCDFRHWAAIDRRF
jgi:hypothetical protein